MFFLIVLFSIQWYTVILVHYLAMPSVSFKFNNIFHTDFLLQIYDVYYHSKGVEILETGKPVF